MQVKLEKEMSSHFLSILHKNTIWLYYLVSSIERHLEEGYTLSRL